MKLVRTRNITLKIKLNYDLCPLAGIRFKKAPSTWVVGPDGYCGGAIGADWSWLEPLVTEMPAAKALPIASDTCTHRCFEGEAY